MERLASVSPYHLRETVYEWRDPTDYWYTILSGAARKCALSVDGRRQILEFLLPGDLFGFGSWDEHRFGVDVIVEGTRVARYSRRRVEMLAESDPEVARELRQMAFDAIARLQDRIVILGRATARGKVGAFLLEMARRSPDRRGDSFFLPMSRYDIADYLALAVETVSRALTDLRRRGVITLTTKRQVRIADRRALEEDVEDEGADDGSSSSARAGGARLHF
jgi:CRP/FNR family transcriptional regulator, nitrogen fixation regulation protein